MDIKIENRVKEKLAAAVLVYSRIEILDPEALDSRITGELERIRVEYGVAMPPGFSFSRRLYRAFHVDPTRHRPSSEALWRRLRDRGDFPRLFPAVDLTNLLSLKFQVPYGFYDRDKIRGNIAIDSGREGERYPGIGKEELNMEGKIVVRDELGPFGNPSADSLRTAATASTRDALQVMFFSPADPLKERMAEETLAIFRGFFSMESSALFFV
jgi:DNA/RNA-binding domain of Phe-tRNA-synthetase-like protein